MRIQHYRNNNQHSIKVVYGLFVVPMVTSFFSVLGASVERFHAFALYPGDRRKRMTRKFSVAWFVASWTLGT